MLDWLKNPAVRRALQAVAARGVITHETLDALPPGRAFVHVRSMLVAAGALPDRDERLTALERWISQVIAGQADPGDRQALRGYALWHYLRRLRGRHPGQDARHPRPGRDPVAEDLRRGLGSLRHRRQPQKRAHATVSHQHALLQPAGYPVKT